MSIRILLADDQVLFREALATLLASQDDFLVVAEATNGQEAVDMVEQSNPEIILMDLRMPVMSGVDAIKKIHPAYPDIKIIMLTTFDEDESLFEGLKAGAIGFLLKDMNSEQLFSSIRQAANGEYTLAQSAMAKIIARISRADTNRKNMLDAPIESLSQREIEVLSLVAIGLSNKEIAAKLVITEGTAKNHISSILAKLNARDRLQAVIKAKEFGIL